MLTSNLDKKLEDSVLRIYEGLYKQIVKEDNFDEKSSLDDLEQKIDIIMDALGLKEEEKEETTEETVAVEEEPLQEVDTEEETKINFVDGNNLVKEDSNSEQ